MYDFDFGKNFVETTLQVNAEVWFVKNKSDSWHLVYMQKDQCLKIEEEEIQGMFQS